MPLNRKIHIGIYASDLSLGNCGGTEVYKHELVDALLKNGKEHDYSILMNHTVQSETCATLHQHAVSLSSGSSHWRFQRDRLRWWLNPSLRSRHSNLADFRAASELDQKCRASEIDLIHFPATLIPERLCLTQMKKMLTFFDAQHEFYPEYFTPEQLERRRRAYRRSLESARHIIAPSQFTKKTLIDIYKIPEDRISFIPVGMSPAIKRVSKENLNAVRTKYHLPERYLFYPANPWPHKNHLRLMTAFKLYKERNKGDVRLVLSGRLKNETVLGKDLAASAGIGASVLDLGFIPFEDLCGVYSGAEALIFPSLFEGFGIPVLEAMACGCPMAVARATTLPEIAGDAALYFDPTSVEEMASCMARITNDQEIRDDLAARGHQRVQAYSWSRIVPQLEVLYSDILQKCG